MFGEFHGPEGGAPEEVNWQGWTPPWMAGEEEGRGPGPRGPFGPGHGWGPRGPFGPGRGWGQRGWRGPRGPFGFGFGFGPGRHWGIPDEMLALRAEAAEVARLFAIASRGAFENKERLAQLRTFLDRSHKELSDMIYGSAQGQATREGESAGGPADIGQA